MKMLIKKKKKRVIRENPKIKDIGGGKKMEN